MITRRALKAEVVRLTYRVQELEDRLCPCEQHDYIKRLIPSMNARLPALTQSASTGVNAAARKSRGTGNLFLFGSFAY